MTVRGRDKLVRDQKRAGQHNKSSQDKGFRSGYAVADRLANVMDDQTAPATARVSAARALAELDGRIGKHQAAPERTGDQPVASLTREELTRELGRLRALVQLGLDP
jgi:hypothetical protein